MSEADPYPPALQPDARLAVTFYRGAAAIMAADLAATPNSGLWVQACGDAHLSNFGGYGSPDRGMVVDINDFDETLPPAARDRGRHPDRAGVSHSSTIIGRSLSAAGSARPE